MPLTGLQSHGGADVVYGDWQSREVVVPCSGVWEAGHHIDGRHIKIANEDRVLIRSVQMNSLHPRAVHTEVIGPKHRLVLLQVDERGNGFGEAETIGVRDRPTGRAFSPVCTPPRRCR